MHTHKPVSLCTLFSLSEKKNLVASFKEQYRGCTRACRHLLRANTDYSLFLLSKTLHIANPPFTNHRTSALPNLVMLSQLTSHANWPRTVSIGKVSCQRDNDKDAKRSASVFTGWEKEINQILWKKNRGKLKCLVIFINWSNSWAFLPLLSRAVKAVTNRIPCTVYLQQQ